MAWKRPNLEVIWPFIRDKYAVSSKSSCPHLWIINLPYFRAQKKHAQSMSVVLMHPSGNNFVRALLQAMQEEDMLAEFNTAIAVDPNSSLLKLLPENMRNELLRRSFSVPKDKIHLYPIREVARLVLPRLGFAGSVRHESGWASLDAVFQNFDAAVSRRLPALTKRKNVTAVYAYEDGALSTFKKAKSLGLKCIYDLPIAYWDTGRRLMNEEAERLPEWSVTLGGGIKDSEKKLERKTQEMELADIVVGPGDFVLNSLPDWARKKKLIMSPFGSPDNNNQQPIDHASKLAKRPLRVLFAGSMGQRKGLGDLFSAVKLLNRKDIELVVMGSLLAPMEFYRSQYQNFVYEAGRPNDQVLALMRSCDVFCLPSIVEGRALVMQEAMSQGLPLVITPNTGGADLIKEGVTGFLVPIRNPNAIAEKLAWFADNRDRIPEMGERAREHASQYTWKGYAKKIVDDIKAG
jgi:glycosyltransferase involved in cell wall biosynthesis